MSMDCGLILEFRSSGSRGTRPPMMEVVVGIRRGVGRPRAAGAAVTASKSVPGWG